MKKMKWLNFEEKILEKDLKIFSPRDLVYLFDISKRSASSFLNYHTTITKTILKLKKSLYCLKKNIPSDFFVANKIYEPAYISLETALSYYSLLPEIVYSITSITTRKTNLIIFNQKQFVFQKIKKQAFTGYKMLKIADEKVLIAEPEKAAIDYLYFVFLKIKKINDRVNFNSLDKKRLFYFAKLFENNRFLKFLKDNFNLC